MVLIQPITGRHDSRIPMRLIQHVFPLVSTVEPTAFYYKFAPNVDGMKIIAGCIRRRYLRLWSNKHINLPRITTYTQVADFYIQ